MNGNSNNNQISFGGMSHERDDQNKNKAEMK